MRENISKKQVEHVAWLARLELTEEEKELYTKQFNDILEYFRKIDQANTENVQPTYHLTDLSNIFREDEVEPSLPVEEALRNTAKKKNGYIEAPRMG